MNIRTFIVLCALPLPALAAPEAAKKPSCDPMHSTMGVIVMDDGDLLRVKGPDTFDYSGDKGKSWRPLTTSGTWPTMDGRKLTVKDGKFISLE